MFVAVGTASASAQTRVITGRITDSLTSEVVSSGQVGMQGTTIGATIRDNGTFTIAVPARDVTLSIRSIGFKRKDVSVPASQNSVQVALARDYFQLEAIVVTGQATGVERRNLANAVATVSAADLVKVPAASVEQALTGKLAGADIQSNSGAPGGGLQVRLRGVSSIIGAATPLYVVDGVIVSDAAIPTGVNSLTKSGSRVAAANAQDDPVNRIADLNPNDIESIEVLKGASAAAIYGQKAANGVILITTKKGRVGAPQFNVVQRFGVFALLKRLGYRRFQSLQDATNAFGPLAAQYWQSGLYFDHDEYLAGNKPLSHETSASMSGGTETTRYFASGLVKHDGGIETGTFANKQSLRLNVDQTVGSRLNFSLNTQAVHAQADRGFNNNDNTGVSYYMTLPGIPSFFDMRGRCGGQPTTKRHCPDGTVPVYPVNPFAASNVLQTAALAENDENVWRFIGAGRASWDAIATPQHSVKFLLNGGADVYAQRNRIFAPPEVQFEPLDGLPGTSLLSSSYSQFLNGKANLVYAFKPAGGAFSATTSLGAQYEWRDINTSRTRAENLIGGLKNVDRGTVVYVEEDREQVRDLGLFAQEELLTLNERLLFTVGVRADQSSNNGDPDKLFYYPKVAASFRVPVRAGFLDEVKLRGAYGQSGNQPLYGQKFTELAPANIQAIAAVEVGTITAAKDIRPERQREIEGGLDAILFGGRGTLEFSVYDKRITDLLLRRGLPTSSGFTTQFFNGGVLRTRGAEAALSVAPLQTTRFQWTSRTTFSLDRSKVLKLPVPRFAAGGFGSTFGGYFIEEGKSPTLLWGNDTLGSQPGDAALGPPGQSVIRPQGEANPDFRMGFANDLTYKALHLYMMWNWQQGGLANNLTLLLYDFAQNAADHDVLEPGGRKRGEQRLTTWFKRTAVYFEDATFWKLRELTLSVDLPQSLVHRVWSGARHVRLSLSGRNLLTITDYMGFDPEVSNFGAQSIARNMDTGPYPPSRSIWFAVDLGF
ncbi:MAG: SusC/RagA family TonB-linked outer membrane protein [Gemmatimonadetes bacterium]|nr:SusC/RagA family TonB-linked outer membrane protein [Gemmatimonadota bacterium]